MHRSLKLNFEILISFLIFSINITAQFAIVTKAKLDAISVNGSCSCDDLPPPPPRPVTPPKAAPDLDLVFLVDGSDSFDGNYHERRTTTGGHKEK